jgi:hypothetical protein
MKNIVTNIFLNIITLFRLPANDQPPVEILHSNGIFGIIHEE